MRSSRPRPKLPAARLELGLATAIEERVSRLLPQHQARGEAAILTMLRDEFGTSLHIDGEGNIKRAREMVRAFQL